MIRNDYDEIINFISKRIDDNDKYIRSICS